MNPPPVTSLFNYTPPEFDDAVLRRAQILIRYRDLLAAAEAMASKPEYTRYTRETFRQGKLRLLDQMYEELRALD